jgi:hypothetical protein
MALADSALQADQMALARRLLKAPARRERTWPVLASAAFAAVSALTLATVMILSPPVVTTHLPERGAE